MPVPSGRPPAHRRRLQLERISIRTFGPRGEEIELCVTLPEDASEPVPVDGATLGQVVDLVGTRAFALTLGLGRARRRFDTGLGARLGLVREEAGQRLFELAIDLGVGDRASPRGCSGCSGAPFS